MTRKIALNGADYEPNTLRYMAQMNMSTMESRKPKRRLTFRDLIMAAQSHDATVRKQAYMAYHAWLKAAEHIPSADRLTQMQRDVMTKIFMDKGFIKPGSKDAGTRTK